MRKLKNHWVSAICYNARSVAMMLRETLEDLKFEFKRERIDKHYSKVMVVIPLPESAYVYRFKVTAPTEFIMDTYDTRPTHSGILHFIEVHDINQYNLDDVRKVLRHLASKLPRKPWQFFWSERFKTGLMFPEYLRAKRLWSEMGVT